jgi:hypothetical protein
MRGESIRAMRRVLLLALPLTLLVISPSQAAPKPTVTATPKVVARNAIQTVRGRHWPVIEFCSRTLRVSVESAQNAAPVGTTRVRDDGRFRLRWIPANRNVGPGRWRLVARMRCESGKDGSRVIVRAVTRIRVTGAL